MKTTLLSVAAIAAAVGLSVGLSSSASAASQAPVDEQSASALRAPPAANAPTAPRHSHMNEKVGVRAEQTAAAESADTKSTPAKTAAKRHDHQRDSK